MSDLPEIPPDEDLVCSECGAPAKFAYHRSAATEPHGETHLDSWQECVHCGVTSEVDDPSAVGNAPAIRPSRCPGCGARHIAECTCDEDEGEQMRRGALGYQGILTKENEELS